MFSCKIKHIKNTLSFYTPFIARTVNNSRTDTSNTAATNAATETSASSSTGSSVLADTGLDLSDNVKEEGDLSLRNQSQCMDDIEMLDTKKDQQLA